MIAEIENQTTEQSTSSAKIWVDRGRINIIMQDRGISNVDLAERMGVHRNAIVRIKREQSTSLDGLEKLCKALNCHPFDIVMAEGFPDPLMDAPPVELEASPAG